MPQLRAQTTAALILSMLPQVGCSGSRDVDVIAVTLEHFTARADTMPWHKTGVTLIRAETQEFIRGMGRDGAKCDVPQELYDRLATRNTVAVSAAPLVSNSKAWRLIRPDETARPIDRTTDGEPIKTVVQLSVPAYSDSGETAFVTLHFKWSMHGAVAEYLLRSAGDKWQVQCSDLFFYV